MSKLTSTLTAAVVVVAAGALIAANNNNQDNNEAVDFSGGVSTNVECEEIAATRGAVNTELAERKSATSDTLAEEMEAASDAYWEKRRALDDEFTACETDALLADPCKELFERSSALAQEILNNIDSGFDEAKFQERERVKEEYDKCVESPPKEDTYPGKLEQCQETFNAGNKAALEERAAAEAEAQAKHDQAVEAAETAHSQKMAELDALEQHCEDTKYERKYGNIPSTGIPVTDYVGGSPACTGIFPGYDPEIAKRIANLESLKNQAQAGGARAGFLDASQLGTEINNLKAEMAAGPAMCETDADCGGPEPVCCNIKEIGQAFCDGGTCAHEKTACGAEEVCAGKPAQCLAFVQVIQYQDYLIPVSQLRQGSGSEPNCDEAHWHGNATTLSGMPISDPDPDGCGYGKVSDVPAFGVYPDAHVSTGTQDSDGDFVEAEYLGGQTMIIDSSGQVVESGYFDQGNPPPSEEGGFIEVRGGIFGN